MCHSQIIKSNAIQVIEKLKVSQDHDEILKFNHEFERDKSLSEELKIELYARMLVIANDYLERHSMPKETPQINIDPGDGSVSGIDPSHVKDPIVRAKYEKEIAANRILAEAHIKHRRFSDMRNKMIVYCVSFGNLKAENKKLILDTIMETSGDPKTTKKILDLMERQETKNALR
jgi:hypothetical protein